MCPICDSVNISPSKQRKLRDIPMKMFGQVPYRCRDCKSRFYIAAAYVKEVERKRQWVLSVRDREEKTAGRGALSSTTETVPKTVAVPKIDEAQEPVS